MLTGEIRNQVDQIWNAFWSGGLLEQAGASDDDLAEVRGGGRLELFVSSLVELECDAAKEVFRLSIPLQRLPAESIPPCCDR